MWSDSLPGFINNLVAVAAQFSSNPPDELFSVNETVVINIEVSINLLEF